MKDRNIVIVSPQSWYLPIGSTIKNIATELAKQNNVLYINRPLDTITVLKKKEDPNIEHHYNLIKNKKERLTILGNNFYNYFPKNVLASVNWIPSTKVFSLANKINNKLFAEDIKTAIAKVGFQDYILIVDNDFLRAYYLKELLKPDMYIYLLRDFVRGFKYWKRHGTSLEPRLIEKADIAIGNSLYFQEKFLKPFNKNSYFIETGCDIKLFDWEKAYDKPADLKNIPSPVIGYVGALIETRLDINMLEEIAKKAKQWNFVLVGPEDNAFAQSALHKLKNVHFLGKKKVAELPAYIKHFDVCINPQLLNDITIGNYPLKADEYLAMGKPMVARYTKAMEFFEDYVYLASSAEEFVDKIGVALKTNSDDLEQKRIHFARSHTWENTVEKLYSAIDKFENDKCNR